MSWWAKVSTDRRLAQLDGGIECGMTAREIARFSGATPDAVHSFAFKHGRKFQRSNRGADASHKRAHSVVRDRNAYSRGDRVDLWGNAEPQDEFALDELSP